MAGMLLLTYNLDEGTTQRLQTLCQRQGIRYRAVAPSEYALPIGALAGIPVSKAAKVGLNAYFSDPMLVMCHILSPQLDAFLRGMREEGVPRIPLKAILTPSNVTWNSLQLRDELAREHEAMNKRV
ncbi:MAG: DUF3783 domain-containing protein [Clostridia bacterium]|nr:DUF3783 domain-containing protein [Clostridia bacterium]